MLAEPLFALGRVTLLGVLNTTPDSFSDGGRFTTRSHALDLEAAVAAGLALVRAGADVIDVGGESTRPGASAVSVAEEIARTVPVIAALAKRSTVPISIDTRRSAVAEAALDAGAQIINDVSGLGLDFAIARLAAQRSAWLLLGHLRGEPATMQDEIHFDDVLREVGDELAASVLRAESAGVPRSRLVVDPGIGFGKRSEHNLALLANAGLLRARLGLPLLVGPSRKAFLGALTGDPVEAREAATLAACSAAVFAGADALRVHDPAGGRRAAQVGLALRAARRDAAYLAEPSP
jgi:dihydropteroate synthase